MCMCVCISLYMYINIDFNVNIVRYICRIIKNVYPVSPNGIISDEENWVNNIQIFMTKYYISGMGPSFWCSVYISRNIVYKICNIPDTHTILIIVYLHFGVSGVSHRRVTPISMKARLICGRNVWHIISSQCVLFGMDTDPRKCHFSFFFFYSIP